MSNLQNRLLMHTWTLDTTPLAAALRAIKNAGWNGVELRRVPLDADADLRLLYFGLGEGLDAGTASAVRFRIRPTSATIAPRAAIRLGMSLAVIVASRRYSPPTMCSIQPQLVSLPSATRALSSRLRL